MEDKAADKDKGRVKVNLLGVCESEYYVWEVFVQLLKSAADGWDWGDTRSAGGWSGGSLECR